MPIGGGVRCKSKGLLAVPPGHRMRAGPSPSRITAFLKAPVPSPPPPSLPPIDAKGRFLQALNPPTADKKWDPGTRICTVPRLTHYVGTYEGVLPFPCGIHTNTHAVHCPVHRQLRHSTLKFKISHLQQQSYEPSTHLPFPKDSDGAVDQHFKRARKHVWPLPPHKKPELERQVFHRLSCKHSAPFHRCKDHFFTFVFGKHIQCDWHL